MIRGPETQVLSQQATCSYRFRIIETKFYRVSLSSWSTQKKFARLLIGNTSISPSIKPVCLRHRRRPWIQLFPKSQVVSKNPSNLKLWDFRPVTIGPETTLTHKFKSTSICTSVMCGMEKNESSMQQINALPFSVELVWMECIQEMLSKNPRRFVPLQLDRAFFCTNYDLQTSGLVHKVVNV